MIKLTRPILHVFLLLIATGCASTGSRQQDLLVTIRPVTEKWIITDLCHRDSADELVPRFGFRKVFKVESRPSDSGSATESPESSEI